MNIGTKKVGSAKNDRGGSDGVSVKFRVNDIFRQIKPFIFTFILVYKEVVIWIKSARLT